MPIWLQHHTATIVKDDSISEIKNKLKHIPQVNDIRTSTVRHQCILITYKIRWINKNMCVCGNSILFWYFWRSCRKVLRDSNKNSLKMFTGNCRHKSISSSVTPPVKKVPNYICKFGNGKLSLDAFRACYEK